MAKDLPDRQSAEMITQQSLSGRAWAEMLLLALIWGASFLAFAICLRELNVFTTVAHRVFWGTVLIWIIALARKWPLPPPSLWLACLIMGLLNNVIPFSLIAWGQTTIESGLASILNAATAIFGILFAAIIFQDERLTQRKTIGVTLGFIGVILAIGIESLRSFDIRSAAQIAIVLASISYGMASVWARKTLRSIPPHTAALGMLTGSTLIMLPLAISIDGAPSLALNPETWAAIAYIAILATTCAYLLYYRVLSMAGSGNLMLVTLLIPPIAIILGAWVLGEAIAISALIGFGIIAIGMIILDGRLAAKISRSKD